MERSRRLDDDALAEEIELYGDLVVAASEAGDVLPQAEIDRLLGVAVSGDPATSPDGPGGPGDPGDAPQDHADRPPAGGSASAPSGAPDQVS